jgi:hypothetical protein
MPEKERTEEIESLLSEQKVLENRKAGPYQRSLEEARGSHG